jgi:signal transduction histidine kinase
MNLLTNAISLSPPDLMILVKIDLEDISYDTKNIRFIVMEFGPGMTGEQI